MDRHFGYSLRRTGAAVLAAGLLAVTPITAFAATSDSTATESVIASGLTTDSPCRQEIRSPST